MAVTHNLKRTLITSIQMELLRPVPTSSGEILDGVLVKFIAGVTVADARIATNGYIRKSEEELYQILAELRAERTPEIAEELDESYVAGDSTPITSEDVVFGDPTEDKDHPDYLLDLAERLRHVPLMYGTDDHDIDRLQRIARELEEKGGK